MKKVAYVLLAFFALTALPVLAEELPEIAPADEMAVPPLDAPAADDMAK